MRFTMARVITYIVLGATSVRFVFSFETIKARVVARLATIFAKFLFVVLPRTSLTASPSSLMSLNVRFSYLRSAEGSRLGSHCLSTSMPEPRHRRKIGTPAACVLGVGTAVAVLGIGDFL